MACGTGGPAYTQGAAMQRVARVLATLAMAIAAVAIHPGTVAALCRQLNPTPSASDVASAPVVFVGTVAFSLGSTAYFTVDEIWRGPELPWLTTVYGGSGDPGVIFEDDRTGWSLGARYLVFAGTGLGGRLLSDGCSPTRVYEPSFDVLRPSDARLRYGTLSGTRARADDAQAGRAPVGASAAGDRRLTRGRPSCSPSRRTTPAVAPQAPRRRVVR